MNAVVVIPSIRQVNLDYLEPLGSTPVMIIDDTSGTLKPQASHHRVFIADQYQGFGLPAGLIPQKNPSCKDLGLYLAYKEGYDTIILLDDDCDTRVSPNYLLDMPLRCTVEAVGFETPSGWCNTLTTLTNAPFWARGYPYEHRHEEMTLTSKKTVTSRFNEGMWCGTPDINGIDKILVNDEGVTDPSRRLKIPHLLVGQGQKLPLSIMNVQLHRDLIPAFYQPPDYPTGGGFRIRRHDDVWSMYVLKTLMDKKGDAATVGAPLIHHRKVGDKYQEALSEHVTNLIQPHLFSCVDNAAYNLPLGSYAEMASELGARLCNEADLAPGIFDEIITDYGWRIQQWAGLFL